MYRGIQIDMDSSEIKLLLITQRKMRDRDAFRSLRSDLSYFLQKQILCFTETDNKSSY